MNKASSLIFKIADQDWEFEAIHRLNYKTFVEEIPQHHPSHAGLLIDKFHAENTYVICLDGMHLAGMVAIRGNRPFSLDQKLPDLDTYLPPNRKILEVRLLSVEKSYRNGYVFKGLLELVVSHGKKQGYDLAIISGTTRQEKLYRHLGFIPFGPIVGQGDAKFQPMFLTLEIIEEKSKSLFVSPKSESPDSLPVSFLPGPVEVASEVRAAFESLPVSHRAVAFHSAFKAVQRHLTELTGARRVELLLGSGSLANDAVAGQISLLDQPGLIVSNGEFGRRLIDHATRFGLNFEALEMPWGETFDSGHLEHWLDEHPQARWLWGVHCETSTGVLNNLDLWRSLAAERDLKLCLDGISSIGTVPVDLQDVYLASCVSGKGLGSYPGLSMVLYNHDLAPAPQRLPRYLDLGFYAAQQGIPFTQSSNLLAALHAALRRPDWPAHFAHLEQLSKRLRARLQQLGFRIIAENVPTSPAVVTVELPRNLSSKTVGWLMQKAGYLLSYRSEYLLDRNWMQICLMGAFHADQLDQLISALEAYGPRPEPVGTPCPPEPVGA